MDKVTGSLSLKNCPKCGSRLWIMRDGVEFCTQCGYSNIYLDDTAPKPENTNSKNEFPKLENSPLTN